MYTRVYTYDHDNNTCMYKVHTHVKVPSVAVKLGASLALAVVPWVIICSADMVLTQNEDMSSNTISI